MSELDTILGLLRTAVANAEDPTLVRKAGEPSLSPAPTPSLEETMLRGLLGLGVEEPLPPYVVERLSQLEPGDTYLSIFNSRD
jgi:hypothetical protein